ncbi:hypothetical protein [Streptomyces sp. NPDC004658]
MPLASVPGPCTAATVWIVGLVAVIAHLTGRPRKRTRTGSAAGAR